MSEVFHPEHNARKTLSCFLQFPQLLLLLQNTYFQSGFHLRRILPHIFEPVSGLI